MKTRGFTIPELMFLAGTRAAFGAGIGLLLAPRLSRSARKALGLTLVGVGALTTLPIIANIRTKPDVDANPRKPELVTRRRRAA